MVTNENFIYKEECYKIIGSAMDVHRELGFGFLEAVYQEALALVFDEKKIPYIKEKVLDIYFKNKLLTKKYVADFVCYDNVIVELKASDGLTDADTAQVLNYLKATKNRIGLLLNFGTPSLQKRRVIL
jgi:GxxExxY protein